MAPYLSTSLRLDSPFPADHRILRRYTEIEQAKHQPKPPLQIPALKPTPTITGSSFTRALIDEISRIYQTLSTLPSLAPGPQVNGLLTRLVDLFIEPYGSGFAQQVMEEPEMEVLCEKLRPICAEAEGELERYWAGRMLDMVRSSQSLASQTQLLHPTGISDGNSDESDNEINTPNTEASSPTSSSHTPDTTSTSAHLLQSFPYYENYTDLTRLECSILEAFLPTNIPTNPPSPSTPYTPNNILFIGCGPLPLTSLCILDRYPGTRIHNIDRDMGALDTARELCGALGRDIERRMTWGCEDVDPDIHSHHGPGLDPGLTGPNNGISGTEGVGVRERGKQDWRGFEVVFLAALVGLSTTSKTQMLASLSKRLKPGALVVVRSARGLRGVLYPVFELSPELQKCGYDVLVELHPWTKVVNSVIVLRVRGER